jgi:hypothetical protein
MLRPTLLFAALAVAGQAAAFSLWNDIRTSAPLPGDQVTIRVESAQGSGLINTILFAQDGVQAAPLATVPDGPSTLEATVPGPVSARRYYGFRLEQPDAIDLLPVRLADGTTPVPADLTHLADDPVGDENFGRVNLDLTGCRLSRDGTRLYAALSNAGGGFPVNSGLTFFSYLLGINNPADDDPDTVLAMIQTITAAGIIEPGLYQVNGTGIDDLEKIGEITTTEYPAQNTLVLSCALADLEANPFFQGWLDPADPRIGVAGFSQQITILGGVQEADSTPGGVWHQRVLALDPGPSALPELADLVLPEPGSGGTVTVIYADADAHCPVIAELDVDGTVYPLRPQTLDYTQPVVYASDPGLPPFENGTWLQAVARFSDNATDLVELTANAVGVADARTGLQMRAAPNPFGGHTDIAFELPRAQSVRLAVFDVTGRRITTLVDGAMPAGRHLRAWNGRDGSGRPQPAGVYFTRLQTADQVVVRRLTLTR